MLRRYHLLVMHNIIQSHEAVNAEKKESIKKAQRALMFAAPILVLALANATWRAGAHQTLSALFHVFGVWGL
jgi:hypothetical protein